METDKRKRTKPAETEGQEGSVPDGQDGKVNYCREGGGDLADYYTSPQSFVITFSYSLA